MKKVILIKEYILFLTIVGLIWFLTFYNSENSSWIEKTKNSSELITYFITILMYIFFIIEGFIRDKRLKALKMKSIKSYGIVSRGLLITFVVFTHILFWYFSNKNIDITLVIILCSSLGFIRTILINRVYISNELFAIGNKIFFINDLCELTDNFGSNLNIIINGKTFSVFCGSVKAKNELTSRIETIRGKTDILDM